MSNQVFVDGSKERDYLLIASVHLSGELEEPRKLMRGSGCAANVECT